MTDAVLALAVYYSVTILAGMTLFVLGFKLFQQGIVQSPMRVGAGAGVGVDAASASPPGASSAVNTVTPRYSLQLENLAPGTAYALMGTILVGIGLFKGPPALTAASEKQNEREVKVAEATRDKAFAEARMPSRSDGTLTGGVPYVGTPTTPFGAPPPGGGGGGIPAPKGVPATPVQLGFPYGVTIKTQMEQLEKQIGELTKQRNEIQLLKEALKKVGEAKTLNQQEQDVFTDWLLYQRLPSGPMNSSANTTFP